MGRVFTDSSAPVGALIYENYIILQSKLKRAGDRGLQPTLTGKVTSRIRTEV